MVNMRVSGEPFTFTRTIPPGVTKAIMGGLAYKPSHRYASAKEFRTALEQALATEGRETFLPRNTNLPDRGSEGSASQIRNVQGHLQQDDELDDMGFPPSYAHKSRQQQEEMEKTFIGQLSPSPMQKFLALPFNVMLSKPQSILLLAMIACGSSFMLKPRLSGVFSSRTGMLHCPAHLFAFYLR